MNPLQQFAQTPAARALGWALVHSLWQGAVVALMLAAVLYVVRSSRARYGVSCAALLLILAAFAGTFVQVLAEPVAIHRVERGSAFAGGGSAGLDKPQFFTGESAAARLLPWLAPIWIAGVLLFHLRRVASWMAARRLLVTGVCAPAPPWRERLDVLRARLRVARPVLLLESSLATVPAVVGYMRPVILMPVGLLAGLPAAQVEAILLHELAHVRRSDYLVNLVQTLVEGLLFYHPAVWWISGTIRAEREHCCDDLVVATQGDAHQYAAALVALERSRWAGQETAMAATGGSLVKRIRRLLAEPEGPRASLSPVFSAILLAVTAGAALFAWQSAPAQAPQSADASPYMKWVQQDVAYIITNEERAAYLALTTDAERERFIVQFWDRRDPTPGTVENEYKIEHYRRIAFTNARYGTPGVSRLEDRSGPHLHHLWATRRDGIAPQGIPASIRGMALPLYRGYGKQRDRSVRG